MVTDLVIEKTLVKNGKFLNKVVFSPKKETRDYRETI